VPLLELLAVLLREIQLKEQRWAPRWEVQLVACKVLEHAVVIVLEEDNKINN
jgi:hypothetical protein